MPEDLLADGDDYIPMTPQERLAEAHKTAIFAATKRGEVAWALQYILSGHDYDIRKRGSRPEDPGWHECRCGTWEGYWTGYHHHVAEDQLKMLVAAGLMPQEAPHG